jgi:hypothetical protein
MSMAESSGREGVVEQGVDMDKENKKPTEFGVKKCEVKLKKL